MKKRLSLILAVCMVVALFVTVAVGCTSKPEESKAPDASVTPSADDTVDLTVGDPVNIETAHQSTNESIDHLGTVRAQEKLNELSGGRMTLTIYPNSTYADQASAQQALRMGELDMQQTNFFTKDNYAPAGAILGPYLYATYDEWREFVASEKFAEMQQKTEESTGLHLMNSYHFGYRETALTKKVTTPEEMATVKLRVVDILPYQECGVVLGAIGTPISIADVYMSLKTGVVQGTENPPAQIYDMKFHEVCKFIIVTDHMLSIQGNWMSDKCWQGLTDAEKAAVTESLKYGQDWVETETEKQVQDYLNKMKEEGPCEIVQLTADEKQAFMDRISFVLERNPDWTEVYEFMADMRK